jgi:quinoprotein glucose dehydrogenase
MKAKPALWIFLTLVLLATTAPAWGSGEVVERGARVFQSHCERCHLPLEMEARLRARWVGRTGGELFERIRSTMPAEAPGSRTDVEYSDVTAYVLDVAGVALPEPLGQAELAALAIAPGTRADVASSATATSAPTGGGDVGWSHFNGNAEAWRYSPLDQIDASNVASLEIAWRFDAGILGPSPERKNVSGPIAVDGVLYLTAGTTRNVIALDAKSGQLLWMWRPEEGVRFDQAPRKGSGRGVAHWRKEGRERIFTVTPGYFLVALNARTGLPEPDFGAGGWIDLRQGLRLGPGREDVDIGLSMPPLVLNDVVVVGAAHEVGMRPPSKANVKGDVRGFNAETGKLLWTYHTIPEAGEPGHETWLEGSASFTGNAGVWAPMAGDAERGLVFLPVESATGDRYGGDRPGANLCANCLVALEVKTGAVRWYYQIIHHDIWDWDNPAAPILADLPDGRAVVVQLTKQSFAYVFDRETGEPIWPIEERPVPQSDAPGEWTSPTQPFPTRPAAYDRQGVSEADLIDFTPELRAKAIEGVRGFRMGPLYTPASLVGASDGTNGTLSLPSATGGTNYEGGAFDPATGVLYVPSFTAVTVLSLVNDPKASTVRYIQGPGRAPRVEGLPIVKPPWGRITAIDLESGDHRWWVPNADTPEEVATNPALAGIDLGRTGRPTRSGLLLTKTLLFAGEGWGGAPVLRAHDKESGAIVAEIALPASQAGQPMTYSVDGKQYLAMTVGDGRSAGELVVLSLPSVP